LRIQFEIILSTHNKTHMSKVKLAQIYPGIGPTIDVNVHGIWTWF